MGAKDPSDVIPEPLRALLDVFREHLADVRFPGVDLQSMEQHVTQMQDKSDAVDAAREALAQAQAELDGAGAALAAHGERALAYAKVFLAGDAALSRRLDQLMLTKSPRGRGPGKKKQVARGSKNAPTSDGAVSDNTGDLIHVEEPEDLLQAAIVSSDREGAA